MQRYNVILTGETPLLMHQDNLQWEEYMKKWRLDPANKKLSVAGDDRTPAWKWIGYAYIASDKLVIPSDNLMTVLREGGKKVQTGKGMQTFKSQTQSGIVIDQPAWPMTINGNEVPYAPIKELINNPNLDEHHTTVENLGFELFIKRAKIGAAKHVRVRPRFDTWKIQGTLTVLDEIITTPILQSILDIAGNYCGLCDWRPSSPKSPGPFGKFTVELEAIS